MTTTPQREELADLQFPVTVVLGQARLRIRDVLRLTAGSLVELDRQEGELAEIMVRNTVVARGQIVSIGGNYGLRIMEVIGCQDRVGLRLAALARARRNVLHAKRDGKA